MRWLMMAGAVLASLPAVATAQTCPSFRWTTLGTAGGPVPTIDRAEPSNLLQAGDERILVDTGDGTVNQLAKQRLTLASVRTVILSHHHLDHTGGLAAVIGLRWMNEFPGVLTVYGPPGTRALVDGIVASMAPPARIGFGLGKPPAPPAGSVRVIEVADGARFRIGALDVEAAANSHFDHHGGGPTAVSLSYRFTLGGRVITYTGDTGPSPAVTRLAKGSDMLVSEVIDLDRLLAGIRRQRPDMTAETAAGMTQHLRTHHLLPVDIGAMAATAGVKRVVLTHFAIPGPLVDSEPTLRSGIATRYPGPVELGRDGATFELGCSR